MRITTLVGQKFGKLTVIKNTGNKQSRDSLWECLCECGNVKHVAGRHLRHDRTKSCGCITKLPQGIAAINLLYRGYRRKADSRNLIFSISLEEFEFLTKQNCHYCGRHPNNSAQNWSTHRLNGDYIFNGIDRKNNEMGYTFSNSLPCCKICNRAKSNMDYEAFVAWINGVKQSGLVHVR